ncbi:hypothetical protein OZ410_00965 [Robiginitalea sp. M366]|uniref:TRM11 family SAM-dependent methyltransferase n=1 Tax=Robiginitalea aestuariiviva TaxID=3036903 RepID=UPI00240E70E0|nr:hypothetical protein [Robiginitalea aestuariiviva]MDG1570869.1 hypothetical protein [Robiginitalea aestuariiviva]
MTLLVLQHPGYNRVFYNAAANLALAELELASRHLSVPCRPPEAVEHAGIRYLKLDLYGEPVAADWQLLGELSFAFAFYMDKGSPEAPCLQPVTVPSPEYLDPKIGSLLKYKGKTNEDFTRMMIRLARWSTRLGEDTPCRLLDPVAGRGTTLFEAGVMGCDAFGVELDSKAVHEGAVFFKKFLERERIRHSAGQRRVAGGSKADAVYIREWEYHPHGKGQGTRSLGMVQGETGQCNAYFKKNFFSVIVGDLPYGIAHTSRKSRQQKSGSRNVRDFVQASLPAWVEVLAPGGVIALSWNTLVTPRKALEAELETAGLVVLREPPYDTLVHRVDQSIVRDVVLARKPGV